MYLARYHDVTISSSGVWRILKRLGMSRLPASQRYQRRAVRWKRYEKQRPGHQLSRRPNGCSMDSTVTHARPMPPKAPGGT